MYFVQYEPLKRQLRGRSLSDLAALPYLILDGVLLTLFGAITDAFGPKGWNDFDTLSMCLSVIFVIGGTCYVYQQNGGKEGFDLIQKYVVLGWIVAFRFFLAGLALLTLAFLVFIIALNDGSAPEPIHTGAADVLIVAIIELIYFQRLGRHIRDTKNMRHHDDLEPV